MALRTSGKRGIGTCVLAGVVLATSFAIANVSTETLLQHLQSNNPRVVESALRQLADRGEMATDLGQKERLAELIANRQMPASVRELCVSALGRTGPQAAPYIDVLENALMEDNSWQVQRAAALALAQIGSPTRTVIKVLSTAAEAKNMRVKMACNLALGRLETGEAAARRLIVVLDESKDLAERRSAAFNLAHMGPTAAPAIRSLINALADNDDDLRQVSAWALGLIGPQALDGVRALVHTLQDKKPAIRRVSAGALADIGCDDQYVLDNLGQGFRAERDLETKTAMAVALADLGVGHQVAGVFFDALHSSQERPLQQAATTGLSKVIPPPNADIGLLVEIAKEEYPDIRVSAINAIGHIHQQPDKAIPLLVNSLSDPIPSVRLAATEALSEFHDVGHNGAMAVDGLAKVTIGPTRFAAARALEQLGDSLQNRLENSTDPSDFAMIEPLQEAAKHLDELVASAANDYDIINASKSVHLALNILKRRKWRENIVGWFFRHNTAALIIGISAVYLLWVAILYLLVLRLFPLALISLNDRLKGLQPLKLSFLGSTALRVRDVLLLTSYRHPRVLEAWIEAHAEAAQVNFVSHCQHMRHMYYPLPVAVDGKVVQELTPENLAAICAREKFFLRIVGEGGLGKTTLACQIALWAVNHDSARRLLKSHRMIPVMLERSTAVGSLKNMTQFIQAIRGKLQDVIGEARAISEWLCTCLLEDGRILVIVDGLSEMDDIDGRPLPLQHDYRVAALMATSRSDGLWSEATHVDLRPLKIDSDHLSPFLNTCLGDSSRLPDTELFEACRRLSALVGKRSITPLLARMFAEQLVATRPLGTQLPNSIPELILGYLSALNRTRKAQDPDHFSIHQAAELAAWECCRRTYRASYATKAQISKAFANHQVKIELLQYLEERLQLLQPILPAALYIKFSLDPLAEYLAALWLLHLHKSDQDWFTFLKGMDTSLAKTESAGEFLAALWDCCIHADINEVRISGSILEEISARIQKNQKLLAPSEVPILPARRAATAEPTGGQGTKAS